MTEFIEGKVLADPLTDATRKQRKSLLAACATGVIIAKLGLFPTQIATLGLQFSQENRGALILIIIAITFYFLVGFLIYGLNDYTLWKISWMEASKRKTGQNTELKRIDREKNEIEDHLFENLTNMDIPEDNDLNALELYAAKIKEHYKNFNKKYKAYQFEEILIKLKKRATYASMIRIVFEFLLPIAFSLYSIDLLLSAFVQLPL